MNVLFAVDEISDVLDGKEAEKLARIILKDLSDPWRAKVADSTVHPLVSVYRSLLSSVVNIASSSVAHRFAKDFERYLQAMVREAGDREKREIKPSIDEYLELRRYTGAIKPSLDMILLPLDIPDYILDDQRIRNLESMAIEMIAVANDVVSFNVEQARGDIHNMAIVIMNERGVGVQEAMDIVGQWYRQRAKDFVKAMHDLPIAEPKVQADIQKYVWGLGNWVTANYEWSFESERFWGGIPLDEDAKTVHDQVSIELMPQRALVDFV